MNLKKILLTGVFLLSTSLVLSQDKLKFDVYSKGEGKFSPRINNSTLKVEKDKIDFSFLLGLYSMEFRKLSDSTYREIVKNNFPFQSKDEFFDYSKDSSYKFINYSVVGGKPREEKKALEGRIFDEKYKGLPELFDDFEKGLLKDSLHFIVNGLPYSVKIESKEDQNMIIYSCILEVKRDSGDLFICPYPIEVYAKREGDKFFPLGFSTALLNSRNGKKTFIEGILKEKKR